ncbi:MAG: hypothetical protein ACRC6T_06650 [Sarcina sp.]
MKLWVKTILNKFEFFELKKIVNVSFIGCFKCKILGCNNKNYWPMHKKLFPYGDIKIGKNSFLGATPSAYIQGRSSIDIGDNCIFTPQ